MINLIKIFHTKNGDGMKDFFSILFLIIVYLSLNVNDSVTVFDDLSDDDIEKFYYIEMDYLYSNDFDKYFKDINIILVETNINPVYKNKINNIYFYKNSELLRKDYLDRLRNKGYYFEANKHLISPIKINRVLAYTSKNKIYDNIPYEKEYKIYEKIT